MNDGQKFASIAHYNLFGRGSWSRVATDTIVEDALAARRFKGLLDYVEALVKLDERVATRLAQHKLADGSQFILHQHEFTGLAAVRGDLSDQDGPIWLRIQRLQRTNPPRYEEPGSEWMEISNDPCARPPSMMSCIPA